MTDWRKELLKLQLCGAKTVPVSLCRAAPFYYDQANICPNRVQEITIQAQIKICLPSIVDCNVSAVPNGTWTPSHAARNRQKREGATKGYPDIIIDGIGKNRGKVFRAEIKARGGLSLEQYGMLSLLWDNGHKCGVFRSIDTLVDAMQKEGWQNIS
jgi:hypothetical protein